MAADAPVRRPGDPGRPPGRPERLTPGKAASAAVRGLPPLRRRPKTLTEEPSLSDVSPSRGAGGGMVRPGEPGPRSDRPATWPGGGGSAITEEQAALTSAATDPGGGADAETRQRAREIAARLAVPRPKRDRTARRGRGEVASVRYAGGSGDIDLDRTLEQLSEHPERAPRPAAAGAVGSGPQDEDIVVRERVSATRSVVLLVDLSGSMRGERARTAAAAVGALAAELARDNLAVIAFWSDAAVLCHLGQRVPPERLVEAMLRIPARGLTNVAFPLRVARRELARVPASALSPAAGRVLLLSDCVHNAGPDPRPLAARLPRLDILLDVTGEQDPELARDLARLGRGQVRQVRTYRDMAPAISGLFAG